MKKNQKNILWFKELDIKDIPLVGGKNAALGEMICSLMPLGVRIPDGFAVTSTAYKTFLEKTGLKDAIKNELENLDTKDIKMLHEKGESVRNMILNAVFPTDIAEEISKSYVELSKQYGSDPTDVAVRSSATAEDLPGASFAGQQETFLNVSGAEDVVISVKKCFASLFTDRAISYRHDKGFSHFDVAISVGIQKMVRSDLSASGVTFTIDTETGFDKVIIVNGIYGLGEMIVQGQVIPDEFIVFKPLLDKASSPIISKRIGRKDAKLVYSKTGCVHKKVSASEQSKFCVTDEEVLTLAKWAKIIEDHFSKSHGKYSPMDIEWAKDGKTNELFIVQARPETVQAEKAKNVIEEYRLKSKGNILVSGIAVGSKIGSGKARVIKDVSKIGEFQKGEVLVTEITDPDWEPIMKIASAIVTDKGGRTSHAAIVSRELGIPCVVGSITATKAIKNGVAITVDCSSGVKGDIYEGEVPFEKIEHKLDNIPESKTHIMINIGSPDEAFKNHMLPVKGVGLGRLEFIIASEIGIHPNALLDYGKEKKLVSKIAKITSGYENKPDFYVDRLAFGIAKIASAFWPNPVIIRFSDFKTNEYRKLLGGEEYEPIEENPMLGWRGASRYYHKDFAEAFGLECKAILRVRKDMGLDNVIPMIPFCRTPEEGKKVVETMEKHGLSKQTDPGLKIYLMCEIPSNVLLADKFLDICDGMSIGSNDLTQLTLGLDRDSNIVNAISNENNEAVKSLIKTITALCRQRGKYIGICGQAPSDFPDFAMFLVENGIESMSLNPDTIIKTLMLVAEKEKQFKDVPKA